MNLKYVINDIVSSLCSLHIPIKSNWLIDLSMRSIPNILSYLWRIYYSITFIEYLLSKLNEYSHLFAISQRVDITIRIHPVKSVKITRLYVNERTCTVSAKYVNYLHTINLIDPRLVSWQFKCKALESDTQTLYVEYPI